MLRLESLELDNFGPFKGVQLLTFPPDGVTIIYGENMRGKTRLLNAIRYAFFGKVLTRGSQEEPLHQIGNWESAKENVFGFSVTLRFSNDGENYTLTRNFIPKRTVAVPTDDRDYREEYFLKRDDVMLGPEDRDFVLAQIMPEQVSRFFLFDGELLQEYEELLRDDSKMGIKITEAIERILGVPILINARADFRKLHFEAQRQASKAAQQDRKTRQIGESLEALTEQRRQLEEERDRLKADLKDLESEKVSLDQRLRKSEKIKSYLDEIDNATVELEKLEQRLAHAKERLKDEMASTWKRVLSRRVKSVQVAQVTIAAQLQQALSDEVCSICGQPLASEALRKLQERLDGIAGELNAAIPDQELSEIGYQIQTLDRFAEPLIPRLITDIISDINRLMVDIAAKSDYIEERQGYVADYDQSEIRAKYASFERLVKEIGTIELGIKETDKAIEEINQEIDKLEAKMRQATGADPIRETRKSELFQVLFKLFEKGVQVYRDDLRRQVALDATDLFLQLTTEPEYKSLSINENYGLRIIHEDGSEIPVRSAGAEHIVALSLMGALQKNAPLRGPIVMDSPFGRLDETHTRNVINALPSMAEQTVLLVYRSELNPQEAREVLGPRLKAEYRLERKSARHTLLVPNVE
ncbi:MAG TPA: AAA family ATPase [Bellilinea sp.]|nr:AAA family ATPase [Bellilinea sp.]